MSDFNTDVRFITEGPDRFVGLRQPHGTITLSLSELQAITDWALKNRDRPCVDTAISSYKRDNEIATMFNLIIKAGEAAGKNDWTVHYHGKPGEYTISNCHELIVPQEKKS